MKIQNPFYVSWSLVLVILLAVANHNGWSAIHTLAAHTWHRLAPNTQHK